MGLVNATECPLSPVSDQHTTVDLSLAHLGRICTVQIFFLCATRFLACRLSSPPSTAAASDKHWQQIMEILHRVQAKESSPFFQSDLAFMDAQVVPQDKRCVITLY